MLTPLRDNNEIKLFTLFLLDKIGYALEYDTIRDIVVQDGVVCIADFVECFEELLKTRLVCEVPNTEKQVALAEGERKTEYLITDDGRQVAHVLGTNLMPNVREQGIRSATRHLSLMKLGAAVDQSYEQAGDGFLYRCSIHDKKGEVMKVSVRIDNRQDLEKVLKNFSDRPEVVYRGVLALLSGDVNYIFS